MTTGTEAYEAILTHHRILGEQLSAQVSAVSAAAAAGRPHEAAVAGLIAYLADEILPHAAAEEVTIYPAAAALEGLADAVAEMTAEHKTLSAAAERIAAAPDAASAAQRAEEIARLFAGHVAKENDLLLPALLASQSADLPALLAAMHRHTEQAAQADPAETAETAENAAASDPQATVLSLLLQATTALAKAGRADRACRLTAAAWAALREPRPDLAVRVTAALHGLARHTGGAPGQAGSVHGDAGEPGEPGGPGDPGAQEPANDPDLDVRDMPPARRHESIFAAYHALAPGTGFVLVNDHDPKPLRYQFEAEHANQFTWDYLEAGPRTWRVRIGRPPTATPSRAGGNRPAGAGEDGDQEPDLDVRQLPHWQRHDAIFAAYGMLQPGRGLVLVNDHDPLPLRYQFEAQHPGQFTWDYLEAGPRTWRVRIGRAAAVAT